MTQEHKITYFSDVKDGKLQTNISLRIKEDLRHFEGKRIELTLCKKRRKRSIEQNNYIHLLFTLFANSFTELTGDKIPMQEWKEMLKFRFARRDKFNLETGEVIGQYIQGTSEMNKTELSNFIDDIIRYGAEMYSFNLPYPNEQLKVDLDLNFDRK